MIHEGYRIMQKLELNFRCTQLNRAFLKKCKAFPAKKKEKEEDYMVVRSFYYMIEVLIDNRVQLSAVSFLTAGFRATRCL